MEAELITKELDKLNRRILKELCSNARISNAEIGRRVGLSSPAVAERILRMEEQGFIKGHHTHIDFDKIGLTIQAYITFKSISLTRPEVFKMVDSIPEIIEWHTVTGNTCILLKIAAFSSKELESVINQLSQYGETNTSLILSTSDITKSFKKIFGTR